MQEIGIVFTLDHLDHAQLRTGGGMDESTGMAELPTAPLLLPRPLPLPPLLLREGRRIDSELRDHGRVRVIFCCKCCFVFLLVPLLQRRRLLRRLPLQQLPLGPERVPLDDELLDLLVALI